MAWRGVEAGIARRGVAHVKLLFEDVPEAAEALGDVVSGELDVHTSGPGPDLAVDGEEPLDLGQDVVEVPGLAAPFADERVAVHRVALPHHRMPGAAHGLEQRGQMRRRWRWPPCG